jgi:hypothetical protein
MSLKTTFTKVGVLAFLFSCASHDKNRIGEHDYDFSGFKWEEHQREPAQLSPAKGIVQLAEQSPEAFSAIVKYVSKMAGVSTKTAASLKAPKDLGSLSASVKNRFLQSVVENPKLLGGNIDFSKSITELAATNSQVKLLSAASKVTAAQAGVAQKVAFSPRSAKIVTAAIAKNPELKDTVLRTAQSYNAALKAAPKDKIRTELAEIALTQRLSQMGSWGVSVVGEKAVACLDNQALENLVSVGERVAARSGNNKPARIAEETARGIAEELNPNMKQDEFQEALEDGARRVEALRKEPCKGSVGF